MRCSILIILLLLTTMIAIAQPPTVKPIISYPDFKHNLEQQGFSVSDSSMANLSLFQFTNRCRTASKDYSKQNSSTERLGL